VFCSNDPYNLNKIFPCFDQPNFINEFQFFYIQKKLKEKLSIKKEITNEYELNFVTNNIDYLELYSNKEKKEILEDFKIQKTNLKLFKQSKNIIANTNQIFMIRKNLCSKIKNFQVETFEDNQYKIKDFTIDISIEQNIENEIKGLIYEKINDVLLLIKTIYEWFYRYFGFLPKKEDLGIFIFKDLIKQISSSYGNIIMDISNFNPNNDVIEKNYLNFLIISQM